MDQINQLYSESLVPILGNFLILAALSCCSPFELASGIDLLICDSLLWWLTHHFRSNQRRCFTLLRAIISALNGFVQERLLGVSTIMVFGSQKTRKAEFEEINNDHCTVNLQSIHHLAVFNVGHSICA